MNSEILEYLKQDYLNNLDLIYVLEHGSQIIYFSEEGILLKFNNSYFLSAVNDNLAIQLLEGLNDCTMIAIHNDHYRELISKKFGLKPQIIAYQYGYLKDSVKIIKSPKITIKSIDITYLDFIRANYSTLIDESELIRRLQAGVFIGAFDQEQLVGFAGIHEEGSIGFVEVLLSYRHQGIAQMLETTLMNNLIKQGEVIYLQVETNNHASMALHEKLGYQRANDLITWYL